MSLMSPPDLVILAAILITLAASRNDDDDENAILCNARPLLWDPFNAVEAGKQGVAYRIGVSTFVLESKVCAREI